MSTLERLWWDYEFTAQMQRLDDSFVLKGGAAAQLFLQPALQRGSRDVDFTTRLDRNHVLGRLSELQAKFDGSNLEVKPFSPKQPTAGLPLVTYEVYFEPTTYKAILGSTGRRDYIKLVVLSEDVEIPTVVIEKKETLVLSVRKTKCVALGALLGDKLTTLASGTIGTVPEEQPKQLYDIDNIAFSNDLTKTDINHMALTFEKLARFELAFRNRKETPMDVLEDVLGTLDAFSKSDMASGDRGVRNLVRNFESAYVSVNARLAPSGWSARALRIKLLAGGLRSFLQGEIDEKELADALTRAKQLSKRLAESTGIREQLLKYSKNPKELKGKPVSRLYWQVVDFSNLDDLEKAI
jgi:hypothetical protein